MARAPLNVEAEVELDERLPAPVEAAAYFVIAEGLTNVVRYAETRNARVHVQPQGGEVVVRGRPTTARAARSIEGGTGLRGLIDRLAVLDGRLEVTSPPGSGTRLEAHIPIEPGSLVAEAARWRDPSAGAPLSARCSLVLAGCGKVDATSASGTSSCAATPPPPPREAPDRQTRGVRIATARIVFITHGQASDEFWKVVQRGEQEAHKQTGAAVSYRSPDSFSIERMRRYIDEAVADQPDGMVISLPDAKALAPSIKAAVKAGIPVITINSGSDEFKQARRARPRRPGRVRGGRREPGGGWAARASSARCASTRRTATPASTSAAAGSATACAKTGGTMKPLAVPLQNAMLAQTADGGGDHRRRPVDGILTLGPGGAKPALDAVSASGLQSRVSSRRSTSRPTCSPPCATARSSSPSTSSPTCRATCR